MTWSGGQYDSDLGGKIEALLAGRPSAKQRVETFLTEELHVDLTKLPMSLHDATLGLSQQMSSRSAKGCLLYGTSMGLSYVEFELSQDDSPSTCPHCGAVTWQENLGGDQFECDQCEHRYSWTKPAAPKEVVAEKSSAWVELLRIYAALVKGCHSADDPDASFTKFRASSAWNDATVEPIPDKPPRWRRLDKYPTGAILRVTDGATTPELTYVRIGGLLSDDEVLDLQTMRPMKNTAALRVVEVINDGRPGEWEADH